MPEYFYEALEKSGRPVRGVIDAAGEAVILERLQGLGYYPLRIGLHRRRGSLKLDIGALPVLRAFFHRIKTAHIMTFTRQLSTLIDAGLPILRALLILREQVESAIFKEKVGDMIRDIESGSQLSEAVARHPRVFDRLYINMVRAGEIGGVLEEVLNRIADFLEKREVLKGKVKSAMAYPAVVMLLAAVIVTFIMITIIPKFEAIYAELKADLPWPTQMLIDASNLLVHRAWIVLAASALIWFFLARIRSNPATRYYYDRYLLFMPVLGDLMRKLAITRFAGTLSTLVHAGVPILQALDIVRDSSGNAVIARAVGRIYASVRQGETIHEPLRECPVFPPLVVHMVAVGEETGQLDTMLTKVAEAYERDVDNTVNALASVIEPLLIVFLGGVIGLIVIALYYPLISLGDLIK